MEKNIKYDALLELKDITYRSGGTIVAHGNVYADRKNRFEDGDSIHTSYILFYDYENQIIVTRNTTYKIIGGIF